MTGKTHIVVGAAAALAVGRVMGSAAALPCLLGGVVGGMLPDTDVSSSTGSKELRRAWAAVAVILAALLVADHFLGSDLALGFVRSFSYEQLAGIAILVAVCAVGRASGHRGFSHSLVALAAAAFGAYLVSPALAVPMAAGYASHLALDLLNKKPMRLLWPSRRGFCLRLCEAGRLVDSLVFAAAAVALAFQLVPGLRSEVLALLPLAH